MTVELDTTVLDRLSRRFGGSGDNAAAAIAFLIEGKAKMLAPVDTGTLKNSIHVENTGLGKRIVTDSVEYGVYVELGTSRMAAQPYLVPATEATGVEINQIIAEEMFGE